MKKLVALILALMLALSLVPATAEEKPYEISIITNFLGNLKETDYQYIEDLEKTLNIKLNIIAPASSAYAEALQIMVTSGDYADLWLFTALNNPTFQDGVDGGLFIPVNQFLDKAPNLMAYSYQSSWEALKVQGDDQIYGIPRTSVARADGFMIRKDWLDNLNIAYEDNAYIDIDELYDMLYAFTYNDPDGNGKQDTFGMSTDGMYSLLCDHFAWPFGLNGWQDYDGVYMDLKYSKEHDNYKQLLSFMNKLWTNGLIDPDTPTLTSAVRLDRFDSGLFGFTSRFAGHMTTDLQKGQALNEKFDLVYCPGLVLDKDNNAFRGGAFSTGLWGLWAISATAKQPERIVEMLDYMLSDEGWPETSYGPEGVTWIYDENGKQVATEQYNASIASRNFMRRCTDGNFFVHLNIDPELREKTVNRINTCIAHCSFPLDNGFIPEVDRDPTFIDYKKYMENEQVKIITGEKEVSYWDELLDGWYKAGGEKYIAEMQAYIASVQGK